MRARLERIERCVMEFCERFGVDAWDVVDEEFVQVILQSSRPYRGLYTH